MEKELIYIGSVNKALKAREVLKQNGIYSQIERGIENDSSGCGYSVLIVNGSFEAAKLVLQMYGLVENES